MYFIDNTRRAKIPDRIAGKEGRSVSLVMLTGFPLGLENLENLEKWEGIFQSGKSQGILNRLEKSGKITQNTGKYWNLR